MADDKAEKTEKASEDHEHSWQTFVEGDGSHAIAVTRCSGCGKEK